MTIPPGSTVVIHYDYLANRLIASALDRFEVLHHWAWLSHYQQQRVFGHALDMLPNISQKFDTTTVFNPYSLFCPHDPRLWTWDANTGEIVCMHCQPKAYLARRWDALVDRVAIFIKEQAI